MRENEGALPALTFDRTTFRYDERIGVQGLDLEVPAGEFLALTGPNGSGKTTVMRLVLGFLVPNEGSVRLFGRPVASLTIRERARQVAWVPQEEPLRENVPLEEYVLFGRYSFHGFLEGESEAERDLVSNLLGQVGLAERARDGVLSLSGGERQRAVLARALAQETPLLLLDEPTAHLDIGHQLDLLGRVRALARSRGVTVVAALHDLNLAARFADRIVVLSHGRKAADGPPASVLSEDLVARVWGVATDRATDPRTGLPYLIPRQLTVAIARDPVSPSAGPVHVVGGGGAAAPWLRRLSEEGYRLTAGALHLLDTDAEVSEALGIPSAIEGPFAPLGEAVRVQHRQLLAEARAIVVAPFAVGPSNLANLEDLGEFVARVPILLVSGPPIRNRDFTGGRAEALYRDLVDRGAREVADEPTLLGLLRDALKAPLSSPSPPRARVA